MRLSRRRVLVGGIGVAAAVVGGGAAAVELVAHGVLPGKTLLDKIDGAYSVDSPPLRFSAAGPSVSGRFSSRARNRQVGYTVGYPPGHGPGSVLPLVVMLHGFGGDHAHTMSGMTPEQAVALVIDGRPLAPMAIVTVDGGGGYWNPHPGDDPMAMVTDELIPLCQRLGLGRPPVPIGTMGISMGGYGALLLAEKLPGVVSAVAAISPAIWRSYPEARDANEEAFSSAGHFADYDVITHARALTGVPVRVASGDDDPFHPGVEAFVRALPPGAVVEFSKGCHTGAFFTEQEPPSLAFLSRHLTV
jgi:pimeloyl-ACP methyl ester carboxylesterase